MNVTELIQKAIPVMQEHLSDKIEKQCEEADVKIYWCGKVLRIDINYQKEEK